MLNNLLDGGVGGVIAEFVNQIICVPEFLMNFCDEHLELRPRLIDGGTV